MFECSIKGCGELVAERSRGVVRWLRLRACRCGAYDLREPKSCTCQADESDVIPTSYWPNLDWWTLGGVEEVILCPAHRKEVFDNIVHQRTEDPSMNRTKSSGSPDSGNRH